MSIARDGELPDRDETEHPDEVDPETPAILLALTFTGLLYTCIFVPLAWEASAVTSTPFIDLILLQAPPVELGNDFARGLAEPEGRPLVYALASLYGVGLLTFPLVLLSESKIRQLILGLGVVLGFTLTKIVVVDLLGIAELTSYSAQWFDIKLVYLILSFFLLKSIPPLLAASRYRIDKFRFLCDGLYGLFSAWLLSRGFPQASPYFTGGIYLSFTFIAIWLTEKLFTWFFSLVSALSGSRAVRAFDELQPPSLRELILALRHDPRESVRVASVVSFLCVVSPIVVASLYYAIIVIL